MNSLKGTALSRNDCVCSVPWGKGVLFCTSENLCKNECPFRVPHGLLQFLVFLKALVHRRDDNTFTEWGVLSIHGVHPVCSSIVLGSKWTNFLVDIKGILWSLWCSCQPLREFVCFDEVRKTNAWNYNPLVSSVLYFASTQGNIHPVMGDVILGEKFPHSMLFDFSWLIALQRAWGDFYSPVETLPILQNAASRLVVAWNRRGMWYRLNLEKVKRETGGDEPSSDQKFLPVIGTKVAGVWRERGLSGSASHSDQSERLGCDVAMDSHHQELGVSIGSSCLACCKGSQASQWKKLEEGGPALCGSFLS
jgi:hypothetical protein